MQNSLIWRHDVRNEASDSETDHRKCVTHSFRGGRSFVIRIVRHSSSSAPEYELSVACHRALAVQQQQRQFEFCPWLNIAPALLLSNYPNTQFSGWL